MTPLLATLLVLHAVHCVEIGRRNSCAAHRSRIRLVDYMKMKLKSTRKCHVTDDNLSSFCFMLSCGYCSLHGHLRWKSAICYQSPCLIANNGAPGLVFASDRCYDDISLCKLPRSVKEDCDIARKGYQGRLGDRCRSIQAFISEGQSCSSQISTRGFFTQWLNSPTDQDQYLVRQLQPFNAPLLPVTDVFVYEPQEQPMDYQLMQGHSSHQHIPPQVVAINRQPVSMVAGYHEHPLEVTRQHVVEHVPVQTSQVIPFTHSHIPVNPQPVVYESAPVSVSYGHHAQAQVVSIDGKQRSHDMHPGNHSEMSDDHAGTMKMMLIFVVVCIVAAVVYFMAVK